ncbi:MAG: hypothetical protein ACTHMC_01370 [Pseudobacter sp.]|uniref:hypothetical protein n=1 Tax=Pseudobacter sp. TaxID=2045420 RepID=UPI003F7E3363
MDVWFNFPDLTAFKVQMNHPPREGEYVRAPDIPYECFRSHGDWELYHDKKYNRDEWYVIRVTFNLLPTGSYANVMLQRAPLASPVHN